MALLRSSIALLKGNIICFFKKAGHPKTFFYHGFIRIFCRVQITLRGKGSIRFGKNAKIDPYSVIASNGGKIVIGDQVGIGRNNIIISQEEIVIGNGTILAPNVLIYDHDHKFDSESGVNVTEYNRERVVIGKNCWIGANTVILKGTVIGDNCLIAAGSVVKGNYPTGCKIVQKRNTVLFEENKNENNNCN